MLWAIWTVSLILSLASLAVMVGLILKRVHSERRTARDASLRKRALSGLVRFSGDRDAAALDEALAGAPMLIVADAASEFMALVRGDDRNAVVAALAVRGLPAFLAQELKARNEPRRLHAAEMMAEFPVEIACVPLMASLVRDRAREVRIAAAISLADVGALPPLSVLLGKIGVRGQRSRRLVELFRKFPAAQAGELRAYAIDEQGTPFVRAAAIEALSTTGGIEDGTILPALAEDPSPDVAAAAIRALGRIGHPDAVGPVIRAMTNQDWEVRAEAAEAARRLGVRDVLTPLIGLLEDDSWPVRYAAAKAVRELGDEGLDFLRALASSDTSRSQRTASLVLSEGIAA